MLRPMSAQSSRLEFPLFLRLFLFYFLFSNFHFPLHGNIVTTCGDSNPNSLTNPI
jgi:hypothetical protein